MNGTFGCRFHFRGAGPCAASERPPAAALPFPHTNSDKQEEGK
jgi:hypothetical protein